MLHAGSLYGGRKPAALFAALAALRDRGVIDAQSFCFRQIGRVALSGFDMAEERDRLRLQGIVEMLPATQRRDILREMISASCLLLLQPGTTVSIPGKLFEYLASGIPIVGIGPVNGDAADVIVKSKAGEIFDRNDEAAMMAMIRKHYELWNEGKVVSTTDATPFTRKKLTDQLIGILERL